MNHQPEHHTRTTYPGHISALADAERVATDLVDAITNDQALILDRDAIEFLARRTRSLVSAAHRRALEAT